MAKKIDLFIVGAQKCATTSLKNYMSEHPSINGQVQTEMTYFGNDIEFEKGYNLAVDTYFSQNKADRAVYVAKHASLCSHKIGLQRLKEHNPDCKIIYMIRNPVDRAVSSFVMQKNTGYENRSLDEAIGDLLNNKSGWQYRAVIELGFYIDGINNILNNFDASQLKVVIFEEMKENPHAILADIFDWINVDNKFVPECTKVHNEGGNPKSKVYRNILNVFMNEKNSVKKVLKKLLPNQLTARIGIELRQFNKNPNDREFVLQSTRDLLSNIYEPYNKELAIFMKRLHPLWSGK
jgi:hypothetical protein